MGNGSSEFMDPELLEALHEHGPLFERMGLKRRDVAQFFRVFCDIDADGSGAISVDEFLAAVGAQRAARGAQHAVARPPHGATHFRVAIASPRAGRHSTNVICAQSV